MDINQYATAVKTVDWYRFCGPMNYEPESVPTSLISLALADEESKEGILQIEGVETDLLLNSKITNDVIFAIGNNHSGTYYPAVQKALPFVIQIAIAGNHLVARNCAINILIDLYYFCPEGGSEELEKFVKKTIKATIIENRENFAKFADDERNKSLIESLLDIANTD